MSTDPFDVRLDFGRAGDEDSPIGRGLPVDAPRSPPDSSLVAVRQVARTGRAPVPAVAEAAEALLVAAGLVQPEVETVAVVTTQRGEWRQLDRGADVVVGRKADQADLVVADSSVSRLHVRIDRDEHGVVHAEDLASANGTWIHRGRGRIDVQPGRRTRLEDGDWLRSGDEAMLVHVTIRPVEGER